MYLECAESLEQAKPLERVKSLECAESSRINQIGQRVLNRKREQENRNQHATPPRCTLCRELITPNPQALIWLGFHKHYEVVWYIPVNVMFQLQLNENKNKTKQKRSLYRFLSKSGQYFLNSLLYYAQTKWYSLKKMKTKQTKKGCCADFCHHPASISLILIIPQLW